MAADPRRCDCSRIACSKLGSNEAIELALFVAAIGPCAKFVSS